jgi:hypothetical protein
MTITDDSTTEWSWSKLTILSNSKVGEMSFGDRERERERERERGRETETEGERERHTPTKH